MKAIVYTKITIMIVAVLMLAGLLSAGCTTNMRPVNPQRQLSPAAGEEVKVTYNYGDTDKVQLSANNLTLKVGQRLVLEPAPGLNKNTRFTSSGDNFFGDIMEQQADQGNGRLVFVAKKPGKGKLQIIPNSTEVDRATDLWVTVQ